MVVQHAITGTGSQPLTHYYFRIAAVDAAGQSAYATASCTTSPAGSGNLPANSQDLASTDAVDIGMNLDFYGQQFNQVYVNWNGNITIGKSINQHISPDYPLENNPYYSAIIAPFFADADNRYSGTITYGSTTSNEGGRCPAAGRRGRRVGTTWTTSMRPALGTTTRTRASTTPSA